jgi:cbb3-type cytochrome oxidase maturation protein
VVSVEAIICLKATTLAVTAFSLILPIFRTGTIVNVLFVAVPVALLISLVAVIAFVCQVRSGQFDDLDTPPRRMLFDDVETRTDDGEKDPT